MLPFDVLVGHTQSNTNLTRVTGADGTCEAAVSAEFSGFCLEHSLSEATPAYQEAIWSWVKTGQLQHFRELLRVNKEVQKEGKLSDSDACFSQLCPHSHAS